MGRAVLVALLLAGLPAGSALASGSGGAAAPGDTFATAKAGGVRVGAGTAPVARLSARLAGRTPRIAVRIEEAAVTSVVARVVVLRGRRVVASLPLGRVRTGRTVVVPWRHGALPAGHYVVRVHARDRWSNQLRRSSRAPGKVALVVHGRPSVATPPPSVAPSPDGVFPVAGPHVYGQGIGADRGDHRHQGQDLAAARGTPVVAPRGGTVLTTGYQAHGAGYYVVLDADDGHAYFFAHCATGSVAVRSGQPVVAGAGLCRVGSTGDSTGPHLHFEEWVGGWRVGPASRFVDPLPQLRAWDR